MWLFMCLDGNKEEGGRELRACRRYDWCSLLSENTVTLHERLQKAFWKRMHKQEEKFHMCFYGTGDNHLDHRW